MATMAGQRTVFFISDRTGITAEMLGNSLLTQFEDVQFQRVTIPFVDTPEKIDEARPDYILVLPWNFKDEILTQLTHARSWGAKFVVPIPEATVLS